MKSGVEYLAMHPGWKTKVRKPITEYLDKSDLATILAALLCFQEQYEHHDGATIREDYPNQFGKSIKPLGTDDIGVLCERLSTAEIIVPPRSKR